MGILSSLFKKKEPEQPKFWNAVGVEPEEWERRLAGQIIWDFCKDSDQGCGQGFGYRPNQCVFRIDYINGVKWFIILLDPRLCREHPNGIELYRWAERIYLDSDLHEPNYTDYQ